MPRWSGPAAGYGDLKNRCVLCRGGEAGRPPGDIAQALSTGVNALPISMTYRARNAPIWQEDKGSLDRLWSRKSRLAY